MEELQSRARALGASGALLCERCEFFQGWADRLSPKGVRLIRCKAVEALVQPPYERCSAFKPLRGA
ncbi:MAG: hypothetical protein QXT74_04165 [Candidatus Nezhaarchaeales archaeon]